MPLPLLNKPSSNIKEVIPVENQKIVDSKTQDIAQKMFPANKPNVVQTESSIVFDYKIITIYEKCNMFVLFI